MSRIFNIDMFDALSKFKSKILSNKRDTYVKIVCYANKARVLLLPIDVW